MDHGKMIPVDMQDPCALQHGNTGHEGGLVFTGAFIPFAFPGLPSVGCVFATGFAGSMSMNVDSGDAVPVPGNRRRLLRSIGVNRWAEVWQVHKDDFVVDAPATPVDRPAERNADGLCTREKGMALAIKTADCQPIFFCSADGGAVAGLHAGWRGNVLNYPATGLKAFCRAYGLHPSEVLAVRGPSLGPAAAEFVNFEKEWPSEFKPWFNEQKRTMDLWRLTRDQLTKAGMLPEHIFSLDLCTHSLSDLFFSYRRGHAGRQASLIWIKE